MRAIHNSALAAGSVAGGAGVANAGGGCETATMNCDRIARAYRALEYLSFGGALQACREMYLDEVSDCRRALLCGDGDGRFLGALLRRNRTARVDYVDLSAGMIEVAQRRANAIGSQANARTRFHVGDVREFESVDGEHYDLITAHFFLDCFSDEDVARVAGKLASFARPGARLLLSDFRIPPRGIGRYVDAAIVRGLYGAFRITTGLRVTRLPDYESALERAGFGKQRESLKLGGLLTASLWHKI
jgi:ubiquinone/menaquinone biosynthesis C-methylase UbiE